MTPNMYRVLDWIRFNHPHVFARQLFIFIRSFYFYY